MYTSSLMFLTEIQTFFLIKKYSGKKKLAAVKNQESALSSSAGVISRQNCQIKCTCFNEPSDPKFHRMANITKVRMTRVLVDTLFYANFILKYPLPPLPLPQFLTT